MAYQYRFGTKERDQVWALECLAAHKAGRGKNPICVHCDKPVTAEQDWARAHIGTPRALGGKSVGVAHKACNELDNNQVVTPMVAKCDRVHDKHIGLKGPGLGRHPMRCGRRSRFRAKMGGGIVPRTTYAERHAELLANRYSFGVEVEDIDGVIEVQP